MAAKGMRAHDRWFCREVRPCNVCELLGIEIPILQGGMAWISEASLASAVSEAGGLGIIAAGALSADSLLLEIRKAKALTDKPFGVNIMLMSPYADEIARLCCEEGVKIVTTGAGSPAKYMEMFVSYGVKVLPLVASVAVAKKMEKIGAAAVIAEGMEAGGHIGKLTTMTLVPQVVDAVSIPVIAAGGIADGRGVAAAFALGASGVQMGTKFLVAAECIVHDNYKKAIIKAKDIDTVITTTPTGHSVRGLRNKLTSSFGSSSFSEESASGALQRAVIDGDVQYGSVMAGQIAALVTKEQTAFEIVREVWGEALKLL
jgi:enoyl-[acyl-carrier protein] reductase II